MIYHFNTLFSGESIGRYYNSCCRIVPEGSWICLWDADVMTFHTFGNMNRFLDDCIRENPDVGLFTCVANRIGTHKQRYGKEQDSNPSMVYHRLLAEKLLNAKGRSIRKDASTISGLMMLFSKEIWEKTGGFPEDGIIAVDTRFSKSVTERGYLIGIMEGLYVMHYYRLLEGNANHLRSIHQ